MKKLFGLLLSTLLLVTLLTACGNKGAAAGKKGEVVEIQYFHTTWVPAMLEIMDDAVRGFEEANPGIKVAQTRTNHTDFPSQLMTSLVGGVAPDVVMANPSTLAQFRGIGAFADLTNRITPEFRKTLLPSAVQVMTNPAGGFDGMPHEGCNWCLFYRKDLFEEAGLDPNKPPRTWQELVEYGRKLTKDTNGDGRIDQYAYGWPVAAENANDYWVNFMDQAGSEITAFENGKWVSKLDQPEALQGTQFMYDLVQTYRISPTSIVEYDWEGVTNAFVSGEVAMMHNGAWVVGSVKEKGPQLDGKWGTAVLFEGPAGPAYRGYPNTFHIMKASQHQDEAWKFLEYLYNTPSTRDPGLSLIGSYCNASGGMLYTTDFVDYARGTYEPLLQPFLDAVDGCIVPPMDPQWMTLNNMFTQSKIQQLLMGQVTVQAALQDLHENLEKLHQAN